MAKFFVLYYAPAAEIEKWSKMSKHDADKGMDEWKTWMKFHSGDFADMGAPLGKTKRVMKSGVSDVRNELTGYSIVEADSHDAAGALFKDHPNLSIPGGSVEVMTITPMPSM